MNVLDSSIKSQELSMFNQILLTFIVAIGISFILLRGLASRYQERKIPVPVRSEVPRNVRGRIRL